jgi:integrase
VGVSVRYWKGAWCGFVNHDGRRKAKRIGDRETADHIAQAIREKLVRRELNLADSSGAETLRFYATAWLEHAKLSLKSSTVTFYGGHLTQHILPALGARNVRDVRRADCRNLVFDCRAKGLKVSTVRGIVRTLSTVLSQAVEDEILPANPALRMGKHLRQADDPEPQIDPFTPAEAAHVVDVAREHFPEWYPWVLTGFRTGMRSGELPGLQWGDIDWRARYLNVVRNIVKGQLTTPKNHQRRRIDLSRQLAVALRLWRRHQRAAWLKVGHPLPEWVFASASGTALDESNVRKAFNGPLDRAELRRRGPHQMRHTFASLLLAAGEPITYVSRQLGHRDSAITLRVYAHRLPDAPARKGVDRLDEPRPSATPAQPDALTESEKNQLSRLNAVVSRAAFASHLPRSFGALGGLPSWLASRSSRTNASERRLVSREGIEPSTRRLRVASRRSKRPKD